MTASDRGRVQLGRLMGSGIGSGSTSYEVTELICTTKTARGQRRVHLQVNGRNASIGDSQRGCIEEKGQTITHTGIGLFEYPVLATVQWIAPGSLKTKQQFILSAH